MLTLALLPPAAAFLALTAGTSVVRSLAALLAMTFTPGYAALTFFPSLRMPLRVGVAAAISLAIFAIGSAFMIGISWFEPWALLTVVLVPSCAILAIRVAAAKRRPEREPSDKTPLARRDKIAIGTIVGALLLWAVSMPAIDPDSMRDLGLLTEFPITWYFAIFLTTIGAAVYATRQGTRPSIMFAYIAALIAMLYSTTPLIYDLPHYQWVYKHVGVTLQFMEVGTLIPDTDLYNRWPGLFALGGVYSEFAGYANPLSFVGWAEFYFIALQTSLVAAISMGEQRRAGVAGLAALLFVLVNWIGQGYFSPQGFTFTLQLAVIAILFSQLSANGNRLGNLTMSILRWITRKRQTWTMVVREVEWPTVAAVGSVALLDVAMTISHQLTPFILLMQAGLLWVCGFIRPKWIVVVFGAIPVLYLLPQIGWVDEHYGIFQSLDPFNNIKVADTVKLECTGGCKTVSMVTLATSLTSWLGGIAAIFIVARRRPSFRVPLFAIGMLSPFLMILGQDYGGEAGLRLVMFCAPFAAILIATAIATYGRHLRVALAVLLTAGLTIGFVVAYYGNEHNYRVQKAELETAEYYFENARRGSVMIATISNVPQLVHPRYASFARNYGGGLVLLWEDAELRNLPELGPKQVDRLVDDIAQYSRTGYFWISDDQIRYSESLGLSEPGELADFEEAINESGYFELWYENDGNRVYRLKGTTAVAEELRERKEAAAKR